MSTPVEHAYAVCDARVEAILCGGRGVDGTLGAEAQARALATGIFRRAWSPLTDPGLAPEVFSRGVHVQWLSEETDAGLNPRDGQRLTAARFELTAGYVGGTAQAAQDLTHVVPGSDEATSVIARNPTLYALSDARRITIALEWPALYQDASDTHVLVDLRREGAASVASLSPSRFLLSQTFLVRLWSPSTPTP